MGSGLVNEESVKLEHTVVLLIIAGVAIHFFSKYSAVSVDMAAFAVFAAMCYAGYLAFKAAQEIVFAIEERKKTAYETLNSYSYVINEHHISPVAFKNNFELSEYKKTKYTKNLKMAS